MRFKVAINVMPRGEIADPQGQAVERALPGIGFDRMSGVRVGKRMTLSVEAEDRKSAEDMVADACNKILANPVIEDFEIEVEEEQPAVAGMTRP